MTVLSWSLQRKIKSVVGKHFKVHLKVSQTGNNAILFKIQNDEKNEFCLFYEVLTEYEILAVVNILAEFYSSVPKIEAARNWDKSIKLDLNSPTEYSGEYVGAVLDMGGSALHRLLLLTSGNLLLSEDNLHFTILLAHMKKEANLFPEDISNSNFYKYLTKHHIMPGVSARTVMGGREPLRMDGIRGDGVEMAMRVMAFLANNSPNATLGDVLKLDLSEAVKTMKSLADFRSFNTIQKILQSDYLGLAESMVASELRSLSCILEEESELGEYPKDILRNRSSAMTHDLTPTSRYGQDSLIRYLSAKEKRSVSSLTFIENVNALITSSPAKQRTPAIIYAALAEVYAVEGERRTLEVARELKHLKVAEMRSTEFYEATVGLINLALEAENADFPFSWAIHLSEHAWVLSSHLSDEKSSA